MKITNLFIIPILLSVISVTGQTLLDDSKGKSALLLTANYVGINTSEETIKAGYFYDPYSIKTKTSSDTTEIEKLTYSITYLAQKPAGRILIDSIPDDSTIRIITGVRKRINSGCTDIIEIRMKEATYYRQIGAHIDSAYRLVEKESWYKVITTRKDIYQANYFGVSGQGKNRGGVASLFNEGELSLNNQINVFFGRHSIFFREVQRDKKNCKIKFDSEGAKNFKNRPFIRDWITLRLGYQTAKYYTFNSALDWASQLQENSFRGGNIGVYYNVNIEGKYLIGLSGGYHRTSNYETFDEAAVTQRFSSSNTAKDSTRIVDKKITAGIGEYRPYNSSFLYFDIARFFYYTKSSIMYVVDGYYRLDKAFNNKDVHRVGCGVYLLNPKSGAVNIGLFIEQTDWQNALGSDNNFKERMRIGATVKFPIGAVFVAPKDAKPDASSKK